MILFIDHYDSFSNNLISWFLSKGLNLSIISYNELEKINSFDNIKGVIYSPGPGHPSEYTESLKFYKKIPEKMPFLGVCLGHQLLLYSEGGKITQISKKPIHGRQITLSNSCPSKFFLENDLNGTFVLYNSLGCKIDDPIFKENMLALAFEEGFVLATEHKVFPRIGVQFHPESFASPGGNTILNSFLRLIS
ncbi:hypothetical protein GCL60_15900 [Silvanigrella paludirubra]|uniref:Glutamine amidotransferase domain-containing protein n=1 Tax=Silvanigrella paludirubra TaxID=2499159 RepID=A0A6N6VS35_9BACT|nr:aminodeoxychorismate/anthranilate synthase component II [Silvanigrella paludirubra]KAB8036266.1 hypothetical protein GCL60_15900 [Silvanigrella paludirubra]